MGMGKFLVNFGGAVGELSKNFWRFSLKGVVVAVMDWDEDDWESATANALKISAFHFCSSVVRIKHFYQHSPWK